MKPYVFTIALLISSAAFAQKAPADMNLSDYLPPKQAGINSAAYAAPKLEWFERVRSNFERARKQPAGINIVFDGDSITDGWQGRGKETWAANYGKLGAFDFGISGDRTENVLWRLEQGQMDGLDPKLVALMIGTNNLYTNTPSQIAEGITLIVQDYRKRCPNAVILLQAVFPRGQSATDPARAKIRAINEIIAKLGDNKAVIYTDFGDRFLNADGSMNAELIPDFLHPSPKGYEIWANALQPVIERYFPRTQAGER